MKKLFNLLAIALLTISTVGISVTKHYCGDILESIAINADNGQCCGEDQEPTGCCHNESENYTLEDDFQLEQFNFKLNNFGVALIVIYQDLNLETIRDSEANDYLKLLSKSPPSSEPDIYIQVQSFLL